MPARVPFVRPVALSAVAALLLAGCGSGSGSTGGTTSAAASTSAGTSSAASSSAVSPSATTSAPPTSPAASGGVADLPVEQILAKAKQQLLGAASVRIVGRVNSNKQTTGLDVGYGRSSSKGTITAAGVTFQLISIGSTVYLKAPDAFWRKQLASKPEAAKLLVGKWIKGPTSNAQFASFRKITDRKTFVAGLFSQASGLKKGSAKTIAGVECIGLADNSGTLWVTKAEARPVELDATASSEGKLTFDRYGKVPRPSAPPPAQTVDITKLGG